MLQICQANSRFIDKFCLFGERHSGTNFSQQCFNDKFGLEFTSFYGSKHFFGWVKPETITYRGRHTLFIGIVRNPYDWIMAMINMPHHVHYHRLMNIESLLLDEWYSTDHRNVEIIEDRNYTNKKRYKNIFEMRTFKYKYLCETMPVIAQNYVLFSYDTFLKNHHNYLNIVANRFSLKCIGKPPDVKRKDSYMIDPNIKTMIDNNVDWTLEESLGFYKRD